MNGFHSSRASRGAQGGATLVVVLVLLLVMTLLGLASLRSTVLEERMSSNLLDRSIGFQSAEAALREAEVILAAAAPVFPPAGCDANGLCARPVATDPERWLDTAFAGWRNGTVVEPSIGPPQFIVEDMGQGPNWPLCDAEVPINPNCLKPRYRVTARSSQAGRAMVMLQTTYSGI
ncbi:MAG: pilus assembly protein [Lysobacteraceae bacterium]|nr:MAG: pilus assembly protein [Xanthomonadaceae bacterium]